MQPKPPLAIEDSTQRSQLEERISLLEYVAFNRSYERLEYDIACFDNGSGLIPDPSD